MLPAPGRRLVASSRRCRPATISPGQSRRRAPPIARRHRRALDATRPSMPPGRAPPAAERHRRAPFQRYRYPAFDRPPPPARGVPRLRRKPSPPLSPSRFSPPRHAGDAARPAPKGRYRTDTVRSGARLDAARHTCAAPASLPGGWQHRPSMPSAMRTESAPASLRSLTRRPAVSTGIRCRRRGTASIQEGLSARYRRRGRCGIIDRTHCGR